MKCPSCADVTLSLSSRESIEIDYCPQCRGVWLDRGELDKIIERTENSGVARPGVRPAPTEARRDERDDRGSLRSRSTRTLGTERCRAGH